MITYNIILIINNNIIKACLEAGINSKVSVRLFK